jgi:Alginate export
VRATLLARCSKALPAVLALLACDLVAPRALAQSPPAAPTTIALGDWQLAPTLELRTRGETRRDPVDLGGADTLGGTGPRVRDAWGVFERARLGLGAERGALRAQFTLQDAHAWGAPSPVGVLGSGSSFAQVGAHEAWIEARTASARPWFFRVGRQTLAWGDGRLLGTADWSPVGRALDAARAHAPLGMLELELFAAILASPAPLGVSAGDTLGPTAAGAELYGAQAAWPIDPLLKLELLALARVARGSHLATDASRFSQARDSGETYTASLRVSGDHKGWKYAVEGAYQLGRALGGSFGTDGADRRAFAVAAYGGRTFDTLVWTPTLRLGGSYASGDDGGTTYKQFDPILPDVHTWHGAMDVFAWSNLVEGHASVSVVPWTDATFGVEYRYARMAEAGGDWLGAYLSSIGRAPTTTDAELGHEIDVGARIRPWTPLELGAGYSLLALGAGAKAVLAAQARGRLQADGTYATADFAHYTYLTATLYVP